MKPITRNEQYLAKAAGEYDGALPEPRTREEHWLVKIVERIENGQIAPEEIDTAIEAYLNSHDADIVTEAELSEALEDKADIADIPDVSGFATTEAMDTALNDKQDTLTAGENVTIETVNGELTISATGTNYEDATQQTHGLMSTDDKTKLDGITAEKIQTWNAAEPNVQSDWNQADNSADDYIKNKPDFALASDMTAALAEKVDKEIGKSLMSADEHTKLNGIETGAQINTITGVKGDAENDYRVGDINISKANIGLGNVDNTSDTNKPISTATQTALDGKQDNLTFDNSPTENSINPVKSGGIFAALSGKISTSAKGANGGVAELDANGKVPSSQLPSYVDDVLSYNSISDFPTTGEDGKIYIAKDANLSYRWAGSDYAVISPSLALGDTSSTAYRGDWGAEDRAAIGTLTDLQTTAKSNLVSAVNEVKTALGNVQGTLTFDNVPTSGSGNPVKSGGIYTALAGKQDALTIDSAPTSGSENPVQSGGVYTALSGKQSALTFDSTPTENSTNPVTSGGLYSALADKVDAEPNKGLSSNNYTTAEKTKLGSIAEGAEVNQNAFANVKVGSTTVAADAKQDTLELVAGSNVTITPDATNGKITIAGAIPSAPDILYAPASPDYSFYYANNGGGNCSTPLSTAVSNYSYIEVVTTNFGCFKSPVINGVCDIWVSAALSNNAGGIPTLHVYTEKWNFSGTTWNRTPVNASTEVPNYDNRNMHYMIKNGSSVSAYKDVVTKLAAYYDSDYSASAIGVYRILGYK